MGVGPLGGAVAAAAVAVAVGEFVCVGAWFYVAEVTEVLVRAAASRISFPFVIITAPQIVRRSIYYAHCVGSVAPGALAGTCPGRSV